MAETRVAQSTSPRPPPVAAAKTANAAKPSAANTKSTPPAATPKPAARGFEEKDRFERGAPTPSRVPARTTTPAPANAAPANAVPPPPPAARVDFARRLIDVRGSADATDRDLVATELARFPQHMLDRLQTQGTRVVAVRNGITEARADLRGVAPRGWPPGMTWDTVPGLFDPNRNEVLIATRGHGTPAGAHVPALGDGHGSFNLVLHETGHALDRGDGKGERRSAGAAFTAARERDVNNLPAYERQAGVAGPEETFAESIARFYGGDPTMARTRPGLDAYWRTDPFK